MHNQAPRSTLSAFDISSGVPISADWSAPATPTSSSAPARTVVYSDLTSARKLFDEKAEYVMPTDANSSGIGANDDRVILFIYANLVGQASVIDELDATAFGGLPSWTRAARTEFEMALAGVRAEFDEARRNPRYNLLSSIRP